MFLFEILVTKNMRNSRRFKRPLSTKRTRKDCCWNCFKIGHLRFQCPYPKRVLCSFCKNPGVRSCDCSCSEARKHFNPISVEIPQNLPIENMEIPNYNENVLVPINNGNDSQYQEMENYVIFVVNNLNEIDEEEDKDIIEIHPENEDLENI